MEMRQRSNKAMMSLLERCSIVDGILCRQHGIGNADTANEAGDNIEDGTKVPVLEVAGCEENKHKRSCKYVDVLKI